MNVDLDTIRSMFLKKVEEFKLKMYSNNKFIRIISRTGELRFISLETLIVFIVFTPLFLLRFSPGVILLSNFVDVLFLSFISSSLFIVLPVNTILTLLERSIEKKALKKEKNLLELGKNIINEELMFFQQHLDVKVELQRELSEEDLIDMIIENSGKKLAYGPRDLVFHAKNNMDLIIIDSGVFDNRYGRFLIFQFSYPLRLEKPILTTISENEEKSERPVNEGEEVPEWYGRLVSLLKSYINLSNSKEVLLRLENNRLEIIICEYQPLGSPGYSQFLQELKDFVCNELSSCYNVN
ncbi:MAG: hypothetical protein B6U95_08570 [Thermofilum sp. ex4484_82]|nr:MAG: hypothetical protein B6U95_08570 [Thermofilum sp. ex4484_82]OYT36381.1 MAG: hypothetical protein B6U96_08570 [Archaeoglobales archaeon ex4484_92]